MGALARRLGRHRSRLAGAAGLIAALAASAAAQAAPRLVSWERVGGLAPTAQPAMTIETDRTIRAIGGDPATGTEARISREDKARVKQRLRRFGELERDYGPEGVIVFDGITETVRAKGHTVHASTGGEFPPRLLTLLNLLSRLHDKYLAGVPEPSR